MQMKVSFIIHLKLVIDPSSVIKQRKKRCVCSTLNEIGLVVPLNGDIGYRPLEMTYGEFTLLFVCDHRSFVVFDNTCWQFAIRNKVTTMKPSNASGRTHTNLECVNTHLWTEPI